MPTGHLDPTRQQFLERLLVQMRSRYPAWAFAPADDGFALVGRKGRARVAFSLVTLYSSARRPGAAVPEEIGRFVAAAGPRLSAAEGAPTADREVPDPESLVWCVRTARVIARYPRAAELVTRAMPAGLVAFISEALPGEIMRGVSREAAAAGGLTEAELVGRADQNTAVRLDGWRRQLTTTPPLGRWLFTDDVLFSSSLLLVPEFLREVASRGQGSAALLAPDRGVLVAAVGEGANAAQLRHLARRLYGRATSPLIPLLLTTDGIAISLHPTERAPRRPWSGWRQVLGIKEPG